MVVPQKRNTRKQQRRSTVQDAEKEILDKFIAVDDNEDTELDEDEEYLPSPETGANLDEEEELEYTEEEDLIADIASAKEEADMVKSDEREVQVGGGRRRGTGTGGDLASTASPEAKASAGKNNNNNYDDDNDDKDYETTHDKRSRAGHMGASAKVGYVDSQTAMTRAKYKFQGPEGSDPFDESPPPLAPAPDTPTPSQLEKDDDGKAKIELGTKLWNRIYRSFYPSELSAPALVNKEWRSRIYHHPVWQEICDKAGLALPANHQEAHGYERPNYFRLAHDNAEMSIAITDAAAPAVTRMCRDCRVEYYIEHPEPIPDDVAPYKAGEYTVTPRMTKGDAKAAYLLSDQDIMSLPYEIGRNPYFGSNSPMYLFEQQHVLRLARQVHGGDVGIAANKADSEYVGRKIPEPHDDIVKHRRNLLRSMLHDKELHLPEHAAICNIYIETGIGDPQEIVKELEVVDWFHRCTNYDPSLDKAHLQQVKRRPRISRRRQTRPEGETLMSANSGGAAAQGIPNQVMTEEEEEEVDQHKMAALDDWLTHRLEQCKHQSYKLDPEGPERPPKAVWPMLDKIDMGHKMLEFAAEKAYRTMAKKKNEIKREGALDKFAKSKGQVRDIIDAPEHGARGSSELSQKKRRKTDGEDSTEIKEEPKLSTLLEHDLGSDWHTQVVERAKELAKSRLF
ncbi:hypothetical protein BGX29_011763 [Mortierella sp. GBA35]|nr:hypothetical protein BGX29_011763 [Mortierella sp. GBA35]